MEHSTRFYQREREREREKERERPIMWVPEVGEANCGSHSAQSVKRQRQRRIKNTDIIISFFADENRALFIPCFFFKTIISNQLSVL